MIKMKTKAPQTPLLPVLLDFPSMELKTLDALRKNDEFINNIYEHTLKIIKFAMSKRKKEVSLFYIKNINHCVNIERSQFKSILNTIQKYYVLKENYSKCAELRDIIKKLNK